MIAWDKCNNAYIIVRFINFKKNPGPFNLSDFEYFQSFRWSLPMIDGDN